MFDCLGAKRLLIKWSKTINGSPKPWNAASSATATNQRTTFCTYPATTATYSRLGTYVSWKRFSEDISAGLEQSQLAEEIPAGEENSPETPAAAEFPTKVADMEDIITIHASPRSWAGELDTEDAAAETEAQAVPVPAVVISAPTERPKRTRKKVVPFQAGLLAMAANTLHEPNTYSEALGSRVKADWKEPMDAEMRGQLENQT